MALTFAIENRANLPDGGPLDISVTGRRGIDIGRDQHLDWSLPDPARVVSSKHCEVRFREGAFWLIDVSTNGTFMNGSPHRMQGPHRLRNGDRVEIGHYIINVQLDGDEGMEAAPGQMPSGSAHDPWSGVQEAPAPPMNITSPQPEGSDHIGHADALDWFADIPVPELPAPLAMSSPVVMPSPPAMPSQPVMPKADNGWMRAPAAAAAPLAQTIMPGSQPAWGTPPATVPVPGKPGFEPEASRGSNSSAGIPAARRTTAPPEAMDFAPPPFEAAPSHPQPPPPRAEEPAQPSPPPQPFERVPKNAARESTTDPSNARFLELIAQGAGLPVDVFQQQSPEKAAEIIGGMLRVTVDELRSFLQARAETKGLVRSTNQTMIQAFENNPLKFSPSTEEAMRKMLASDNRSYLAAIDAFQQSFRDLKTHQLNTYGAMQQALKMLIEDFDPATIERMTEQESGFGGVMSNRKAKLWEAFSAKWKAKAGRHDNGLVDVFMIYFAECYDRMTSKLR